MRSFIYVLFALLATGCAGIGGGKLSGPLDEMNSAALEPGYGYLVVLFDTNNSVEEVRIKHEEDFFSRTLSRNIPAGKHVEFYSLPAGSYRFTRIVNFHGFFISYFDLDDDGNRWAFTITPNKINYVGDLIVRRGFLGANATLRRVNRSALLYNRLVENDPDKLEAGEYVYAGWTPDEFFQHLEAQQRKRKE